MCSPPFPTFQQDRTHDRACFEMLQFLTENNIPVTRTRARSSRTTVANSNAVLLNTRRVASEPRVSLHSKETVYSTQSSMSLSRIGLGRLTSTVAPVDSLASAVDSAGTNKSYVLDSELGNSIDLSSCYGATRQDYTVGSINHISESEDELV